MKNSLMLLIDQLKNQSMKNSAVIACHTFSAEFQRVILNILLLMLIFIDEFIYQQEPVVHRLTMSFIHRIIFHRLTSYR